MIYSSLLFATSAAAAYIAADPVNKRNIYARQDEDVTVSTITPETVTTSVENASTTDVTISGRTSTFTFGTEESDTTEVTVTDSGITTTIEDAAIDATFGATETVITVSSNEQVDVTFTEISTAITLPSVSTVLSLEETQRAISMADLVTELSIPDGSTVVTYDGITTTIVVPGTSTEATITGPSTEVTLDAVSTTITLDGTSTTVSIASTTFSTSLGDVEAITETLSYSTTETVQLGYSESVFSVSRESTVVTVSYTSTEIVLSIPETVETVSGNGLTTVITIPEVVTTITLSENFNSTTISGSESSTTIPSSSEESSSSSTTSSSSSISSSLISTSSTTQYPPSSFANSTSPSSFPTYCEAVLRPLSPEDAVLLSVLFEDRDGASSFIDYVVDYISDLLVDVDALAIVALDQTGYAFTTEFERVDNTGILGLASAAPIYTCHLSSLWDIALSNPEQYAKRAVPSPQDNTKMIVLFEKRNSSSNQEFSYAELLADETNELVEGLESVSAAAAASNTDAYPSLFAGINIDQLLSIVSGAPIYTEGLSEAFAAALSEYSSGLFPPTTVTVTARTYTNVSTIVTNVVSGNVTVPVTRINTVVVTNTVPTDRPATVTRTPADPTNPVKDTVVIQPVSSASDGQAFYTHVRDGVTYTNAIVVQTVNFANKMGIGMGAGLLAVAALLM